MKSGKGPWVPVLEDIPRGLRPVYPVVAVYSFWHAHHPKVGIMWLSLLFGLACDCFYQCIVEMTRGNIWGWIIKDQVASASFAPGVLSHRLQCLATLPSPYREITDLLHQFFSHPCPGTCARKLLVHEAILRLCRAADLPGEDQRHLCQPFME